MWQKLNIAIFSDTINMMNFKLCMVVVLIDLYPFIPLSVTLIEFQGHSSVSFSLKIYVMIRLSGNFVWLLITLNRSWLHHNFLFSHMFKGDYRHISWFEKNFDVANFLNTVKARSFKLCMIITLLGFYIFIGGFDFVSRSQVCQK